MKKKKFILIGLGVLLSIYICFVGIDCFRLNTKNDVSARPLIVITTVNDGETLKYTGLGYSVEYKIKYEDIENGDGITQIRNIYSANFKLFNVIPLWAWTEY